MTSSSSSTPASARSSANSCAGANPGSSRPSSSSGTASGITLTFSPPSTSVTLAVEQLGVLAHQELGAERAAGLLVGEQAEDHVARRRLAPRLRPHERSEHHRDAALHVKRTASPHVAVGKLAGERRALPVTARG